MAAELGTRLRRDYGHDLTVPAILKARALGLRALAAGLAVKGNRT
ncbi:hypothetical protein OG373_37815 [Streptomyces avidinii]|nr:hypothetical protein OG373_37815 [Streptomyces avidinii]